MAGSKRFQRFAATSIMSVFLFVGGCGASNEEIGSVVGAVAGGYIGSQFGEGDGKTAATILGAVLGAYIGSEIGRDLDDRDLAMMNHTTNRALSQAGNGTTYSWQNPGTGARGSVTPRSSFHNDDGTNCREFSQSVNAKGRYHTATGVACEQSDGSWKIVG